MCCDYLDDPIICHFVILLRRVVSIGGAEGGKHPPVTTQNEGGGRDGAKEVRGDSGWPISATTTVFVLLSGQ